MRIQASASGWPAGDTGPAAEKPPPGGIGGGGGGAPGGGGGGGGVMLMLVSVGARAITIVDPAGLPTGMARALS
jgi:hypothetical protein